MWWGAAPYQSQVAVRKLCVTCDQPATKEAPLFKCVDPQHRQTDSEGLTHRLVCAKHALYGEEIVGCDDSAVFCPECAYHRISIARSLPTVLDPGLRRPT